MKLLSYKTPEGIQLGIKVDEGVIPAGPIPMVEALARLDELKALVARADRFLDESRLELVAPVQRPSKIVCVGLNYSDHAAESNLKVPEKPLLFAKWANAIAGPGDEVAVPVGCEQMDYEAELGVVIGRTASRVSVEEALSYVGGYTCLNDLSARDFQFGDGQWVRGKGQDGFCPSGPYVVTPDELPDPQALQIRCVLNGQVMQDSTTANMIFNVAHIISYISQGITLEPGDIIATGTPPGVGMARKPPVFLKPGDEVTIEIERIGSLTNKIVAGR